MKQAIIYKGPSLIDGAPIVVIANGKQSKNAKTGNMVQTYILRADVSPIVASKTGKDFSICGDCKHRGIANDDPKRKLALHRSCYVNLGQGPLQVFKAFQNGKYPTADAEQTASIGKGRMVRLGTYGDPAAVPQSIWDDLLSQSAGHTGYTHNGASTDVCMVSADSLQDAVKAWAHGKRTFRVIKIADWKANGKASLASNEILCPASHEAGQRVQCNDCKLCSGSLLHAKSIAIVAHGTGKNFH